MIFAMHTHIGQIRQRNEDSVTARGGKTPFIAVADGMGGHNAGEIASKMAIGILAEALSQACELPAKALVSAVKLANKSIFERSRSDARCLGMGTTLTAAVFERDTVWIANVGDSRAYRLTGELLTQLTTDHSLVEELVAVGQLTREEAFSSPKRNIITRALGTDENVSVDIFESIWLEGDILLLCSDGLTTHLNDADIRRLLQKSELSLDERAHELIDLANERGGRDNVTVALALYDGTVNP